MKHVVKHDLSPDLAKKALEKALENYQERFASFHPKATWKTEKLVYVEFKAKGIGIKGEIELFPHEIVFDLDVPFLLRPFKGQAIELVESQIRQWSEKAKSGQV